MSIKGVFLNQVLEDLKTISELEGRVHLGQEIVLDLDKIKMPCAFIFTEESVKVPRNRIQELQFDLIIHIWISRKGGISIEEQSNDLDAKVERALLSGACLGECNKLIPDRSETFYVDDAFTGMLQSVFKVVILHEWGNPFNRAT